MKEFSDLTPNDLPDELSPLKDIQHAIDLISGSQIPNSPHYKINPTKQTELKWLVELLKKSFNLRKT